MRDLPLRHAVLLGALQGPAELLPVSSSGHVALVPWLLGWPCAGMAPDARKSLEVALHAGSAPALALAVRREGLGDLAPLALTLLPPALAGLLLERPIEQRLGGPRSVAGAQLLAGTALLLADRAPELRSRAVGLDHLAVGLAQAAALVPGLSRSGAALTAARLRGLSRPASLRLALRAAVPVTVAAAGLKAVRAARGGLPPGLGPAAGAGAGAALVSGFASLPLVPLVERRAFVRSLAAYRIALGAFSLALERWRIRPFRPIVDPQAGDTSYLRSPQWPLLRRFPLPTRSRPFGSERSPGS